jgi:hypothetical protein
MQSFDIARMHCHVSSTGGAGSIPTQCASMISRMLAKRESMAPTVGPYGCAPVMQLEPR